MSVKPDGPRFSPGLDLSRRFFEQAVEPLIAELKPDLEYAAALIGDGSEVLGFDDPISTDHDWGPRALLFLSSGDFRENAFALLDALDARLPDRFEGGPVRFPDQDRFCGIDPEAGLGGSESHGVEVHTLDGWVRRQLGVDVGSRDPSATEWAAMDEQKLLSVTAGAVFRDDHGELTQLRRRLDFFPPAARLGKLTALWSEVAAEAPFVGRCGDVGDDLGSRFIAAGLAEKAVRIGLLIDGRYAPYSKWLGSAFAASPSAGSIGPSLAAALKQTTGANARARLQTHSRPQPGIIWTADYPGRSTRRSPIITVAPTGLSMPTRSRPPFAGRPSGPDGGRRSSRQDHVGDLRASGGKLGRIDGGICADMNFTVHGLSPDPFVPLFGLSDEELAKHRARRVVVEGPGYPERIEMRDAEPGETLLLVNFEHQDADTPYRSSHAIYVREGATKAWSGDHLPEVIRKRLLSLRGFSAEGLMVDADVVEGRQAEPLIERLLGDPAVAYIHAHYARPGCYAARIDRA